MLNIYDVTIETNNDKVIVEGLYLTDEEGNADDAVQLAIELLQDEGDNILKDNDGYIAYVSNTKCVRVS